jgi:hypothetical protein
MLQSPVLRRSALHAFLTLRQLLIKYLLMINTACSLVTPAKASGHLQQLCYQFVLQKLL